VTINAGIRSGYRFNGWEVIAGNVSLMTTRSAADTEAYFMMPAENVVVLALWVRTGDGIDGGDGETDTGGGSDNDRNKDDDKDEELDPDEGTDKDDETDTDDDKHEPGGKDPHSPPNPTQPENVLSPKQDGGYYEHDPDGNLIGEWRWDETIEEWVFEAAEPTGPSLPKTGDPRMMRSNAYLWALLLPFALVCILIGYLTLIREKFKHDKSKSQG